MIRSAMAGAGAGQGAMMVGGRHGSFFRTLGGAASAGAGSGSGSSSPIRTSFLTDNSHPLSLSLNPPSTFYHWFRPYPSYDDDFVLVSGYESSEDGGSSDDSALISVPSSDEVQLVVSALQQVSPVGSELDWTEPPPYLSDPRMLQHSESDRVYDAFHLLQTDPCVQKMVISLSSDKEVWNAVLKNEVVHELRRAFQAAEGNALPSSYQNLDSSNLAAGLVSWIFDGTKTKVRGVIEKIRELVNQLFPPREEEKAAESETASPFGRLVDTAYMLCVVVMLVVVVGRTIKYHTC